MDPIEKPSSDHIVLRGLLGGAVWGVAWSLFSCFLSGRSTPFFNLVMNGLLLGLVFGFANAMLILLAGGKHSISLELIVLFFCGSILLSGTLELFLAHIVAVVIGSWLISDFALTTKTLEAIPERKEKRKNG